MNPSISIAMATYNGESYILEQLNSIASQSLLPMELVVSDDGSTDSTLEVVARFAKTAPFDVRVLPQHDRLGFSDNFLHAAEHCRGDLVAFCDQDDKWLPGKLEKATDRLVSDGSLLAIHRLIVTDKDLQPTGLIWDQGIADDRVVAPLEVDPYGVGWGNSMLFVRELLELLPRSCRPAQPERGGSLPLSHDHWVHTLSAALGRVSHLAEPLLLYRQHGGNAYGVGRMPLSIRIRTAVTIHRERFIEEAHFDMRMSQLFGEVGRGCTRFAAPAVEAAEAYRRRAYLCEQRLRTYTADRLSDRLSAFKASRSLHFYKPWLGSTVKEAVFGVSGLSKLIENGHRPPHQAVD